MRNEWASGDALFTSYKWIMNLVDSVRETIQRYQLLPEKETIVIGLSGGADSVCLLHVLRALLPNPRLLRAGHLHHGIRGEEADRDARFAQALCDEWDIACTVGYADIPGLAKARHQSIEETARQERYQFLGNLADSLGTRTIAVAHHADDQVETILMHLLRGAGLAGLRGMLPLTALASPRGGDGLRLIRPLIDAPRQDILAYNETHGLESRLDRTNLDTTYFRNRLRHELIPLLESYNPNLRQRMGHMAHALAGDYALVRNVVEQAWHELVNSEENGAILISRSGFASLAPALQRSLIRKGVQRLDPALRDLNWIHVQNALDIASQGTVGDQATLPAGLMLKIGYDELILAPEDWQPPLPNWPRVNGSVQVLVEGVTDLPDCNWQIITKRIRRDDLPPDWRSNTDRYCLYLDMDKLKEPIHTRPRQSGDWLQPLGLNHRQTVRELMINIRVPRAERAQVPLLVAGNEILWVIGWRVDGRHAITADTNQVLIVRLQPKE